MGQYLTNQWSGWLSEDPPERLPHVVLHLPRALHDDAQRGELAGAVRDNAAPAAAAAVTVVAVAAVLWLGDVEAALRQCGSPRLRN